MYLDRTEFCRETYKLLFTVPKGLEEIRSCFRCQESYEEDGEKAGKRYGQVGTFPRSP